MRADLLLKIECELGEGPIWCPRRGVLFWTDIAGRTLHRLEPDSGAFASVSLSHPLCAFALMRGQRFLGAFANELAVMDESGRRLRHLHTLETDCSGNRLNDGKSDRNGRFWIGSMNTAGKPNAGSLYRLDADGSLHHVLGGISTSNGLGWSPNGKTFYMTDSRAFEIYAFDYAPETGTISNRHVFVRLAADAGRPDGLTVDSAGYVWSANWDGGRVTRYSPTGEIVDVVYVPVPRPTSVTLGGPALDTLFITSARTGLSAEQLDQAPLSGSVFSLKVDVPGLPEPELRDHDF